MAKSDRNSIRGEIKRSFSQLNKVITASLRSLPTETGDRTYVTEPSATTGVLKDLGHVHIKDVETLIDVTKSAATGEPVNDREYIMERVIQVRNNCSEDDCISNKPQLAAELPSTSRNGKALTNTFLTQLWNDLKHPPLS